MAKGTARCPARSSQLRTQSAWRATGAPTTCPAYLGGPLRTSDDLAQTCGRCDDHLPEDFTSFLARSWAYVAAGDSITWGREAHALADALAVKGSGVNGQPAPVPGARDPSYLHAGEEHAWVDAMRGLLPKQDEGLLPKQDEGLLPKQDEGLLPKQDEVLLPKQDEGLRSRVAGRRPELLHASRLHIDLHGKRDTLGEGDCDIGVGACRAALGDAAAEALATTLSRALQAALPDGFIVDPNPRLQGCYRSVPRHTLTQSAMALGFVPVQLELGYRLRRTLARDWELCRRLGDALGASAPSCLKAVQQQCEARRDLLVRSTAVSRCVERL